MIRSICAVAFVCAMAWGYFPEDTNRTYSVIAFGSCNDQHASQQHWEAIAKNNPDLWIWTGDAVYADTIEPDVMRDAYEQLYENSAYRAFRTQTSIIGTWDDHDYGQNNAGKTFPMKAEAQQMFLDFLEEPQGSMRRQQEGVYAAYTLGEGAETVKVILLDDRYHADRAAGDLLGTEQMRWLKDELQSSRARLNIIVSGIQVLSEQHRYEKWADFPLSRQELFGFIRDEKIPGVLFISGDRHFSEISKHTTITDYPIVDVTVSGLTHSWEWFFGEENRYRVGDVFNEKAFGLLKLDWEKEQVIIEIRDLDNVKVHSYALPLGQKF